MESAATAIRALNPDVTVDTYYELVDASNIAGLIEPYDQVIDATDNFAANSSSMTPACWPASRISMPAWSDSPVR